MKKITGIYKILNIVNGKFYIGSSVNIKRRFALHKSNLRKNNHHSAHLQNAWNKHGEANFVLEIIEDTKLASLLIEREQYYLDELKPYERTVGYNINLIATSRLGIKTSQETRQKISETRIRQGTARGHKNPMYGVSLTGESHGMYGKKHSDASKRKMSDNHVDVSGEKNPRSKLDWVKVQFIRTSYKDKTHSVKELMQLFMVGQSTIYNVIYQNTWKSKN